KVCVIYLVVVAVMRHKCILIKWKNKIRVQYRFIIIVQHRVQMLDISSPDTNCIFGLGRDSQNDTLSTVSSQQSSSTSTISNIHDALGISLDGTYTPDTDTFGQKQSPE
ncbi:hypothetical protein MHBO_004838, partial [Bonamia ostreae]